MPHRVVNFLRASTENISIKSATRARSTRDHPLDRRSHSPYATSIFDGEDAARMHDGEQHGIHKKHHRLSFSFGRVSKDTQEVAGASLDWNIESPPVLFLGDTENSTGALVSGQMCLEVKEETLAVDSFEASLNVHVLQKKPFQNHCPECTNQYAELKHWSFLSHPTTLRKGKHLYPFSILLGGHLPASMDSPIMSISYEFKAEVHVSRNPASSTGSIVPIKFERVLDVKRALPESELPHHSVRVFPPTNIKTSAHYTQVIHPTGRSNLSMRLDGITNKNEKNKTLEFWRLKKITWRLEETIKTVAPACEKHSPPGDDAGSKKGVQRVETRTLGEKSLTEGWKSDYLTNDGSIEFELDYGVMQQLKHHHQGGLRYACDSKSRDGTEVSHSLMIELVVSREWSPVGRPQLLTQTGTGRILRMHYQVSLTEPSGLGVSWDNESPPIYQDVPPSPPAYPDQVCPIDYESLEPLDAARDSEDE